MTEFKPYPEYKDSGIEWFDDVPATWRVVPLMSCVAESRRKNAGQLEKNLLSLSYGRILQKDIDSNEGLLPESFDSYQIVQPDDVVFRFTDLQNDKRSLRSALVRERGIITSAYLAVTPRSIDPSFFAYCMRDIDHRKIFYAMGGGLRQSMNFADIRRLPVLLPSFREQRSIASYLDRETAEIDAFIADQEELIGLLAERRAATISHAVTKGLDPSVPMKDSGSAWFPVIPDGWVLIPIGLGSNLIQTGPFGSQLHAEEYVEDGVPVINPMHIVNGRISPAAAVSVTEGKSAELRRHALQAGDVIVARRGELGRCAVATSENVGYLCGTGSAIIRLNRARFVPEYFQLVFSSEQARHLLLQYSIGSTMDNLNADVLAGLRVPCPPVAEQRAIVDHLEHETSELDAAIADAREAIALSKERRAALISAAVTGKIDVRGAV